MRKEHENKYQWNASDYAKHSASQQKWARELISKLSLTGNEILLDIGSGDGKVSAEIATFLKHGNVVGIDNSKEMVSLASDKFPASEYPNLKFIELDARELSFESEFDIVFSNAVLHWIIDHRPVLSGIYSALKSGGKVLIQMGGKGNAIKAVEAVNETICNEPWEQYFNNFSFPYGFYSPEEYESWLKEAGFSIDNLSLIPKDMVHDKPEKFKGWFRTTWLPYLNRVPEEEREDFIDSVTELYIKKNPPDLNGKIVTRMQRLEFLARKE